MRPSCSSALVPAVFLILVTREEDFPIDPRRQYPLTARSAVAYYPAGCSPTSHLFTPAPLGSLEERVPPAQERLTAFVTWSSRVNSCPLHPALAVADDLNQTSGDSYTGSTVPEFSSVRHAHGKRRATVQACAQRTLRRLCTNVMWFDLGRGMVVLVRLSCSGQTCGQTCSQELAVGQPRRFSTGPEQISKTHWSAPPLQLLSVKVFLHEP